MRIFTIIFCVTLLASISVIAGELQFPAFEPNDNEATLYAPKVDALGDQYVECLFYATWDQVFGKDLFDQTTIDAICEKQETEYYKSVYYSSFGGPNKKADPRFRHNTARDVVRDVKADIIAKIKNAAKQTTNQDPAFDLRIVKIPATDLRETYIKHEKENLEAYLSCLMHTWIQNNLSRDTQGLERYSDAEIFSQCTEEASEYYQSIYASAFQDNPEDATPTARHNTAKKAVLGAKKTMFLRLEKQFPLPKK